MLMLNLKQHYKLRFVTFDSKNRAARTWSSWSFSQGGPTPPNSCGYRITGLQSLICFMALTLGKKQKKEIKLHGHAFGCWICVPSLKCKIKLYYSRAACFSPSFLSSYHWPPTDLHHFSGWRWSSSWKDALLTRDSWWFWRWNAHRGSMSIRGQVDVVLVAHLASPIFHPF